MWADRLCTERYRLYDQQVESRLSPAWQAKISQGSSAPCELAGISRHCCLRLQRSGMCKVATIVAEVGVTKQAALYTITGADTTLKYVSNTVYSADTSGSAVS